MFQNVLNLNDYQFKASRYSYGLIYLKTRVMKSQKPKTDSQKPKRNSSILQKKIIKLQEEKQKEEMNKEELK